MTINFIDVGCAGYIPYPWDKNNYGKYINNIISFDLLGNELNYINEEFSNNKVFMSAVFDKEQEKEFYLCKRSRVSSLFKPNISLLKPYLSHLNKIRKQKSYNIDKYKIEQIKKVKCIRLDTVIEKVGIDFDFLKTDTEGADFQVIKSLGKYLNSQIVGICAELYFKEMYKGITLFEEVNEYLKNNGFYEFKLFGGIKGYWGNFLYIREDNFKLNQISLIKKAYQVIKEEE